MIEQHCRSKSVESLMLLLVCCADVDSTYASALLVFILTVAGHSGKVHAED